MSHPSYKQLKVKTKRTFSRSNSASLVVPWQHWAHKTMINKTKNTTPYALDTTLRKQTQIT